MTHTRHIFHRTERHRPAQRHRRLRHESLEPRQLLTAFSIGDTSAVEGDESLVLIDRFVYETTLSGSLECQAYGPDGNNDGVADLYVTDMRTGQVLRFDGTSGSLIDVFVEAGAGGLHSPVDLEFGPDGNLYVSSGGTLADPENNAILRYDGQGGTFLFPGGTAGPFIDRFGAGSLAVFTVELSEGSTSPVSVDFNTLNGTATAGSDFMPVSGTLRFAPGETSKKIIVLTLLDAAEEGPESFFVTLSNPVGGSLLDSQGVATILPPTKSYVVDDASADKTFEYGSGGLAIENSR